MFCLWVILPLVPVAMGFAGVVGGLGNPSVSDSEVTFSGILLFLPLEDTCPWVIGLTIPVTEDGRVVTGIVGGLRYKGT